MKKILLLGLLIALFLPGNAQRVIDLPPAGTLTGAELLSISIGGTATRKTTTQDIANLAAAGDFIVSPTLADRDAVPMNRRKIGLHSYVVSNMTTYRLVGSVNNANWQVVPSGGGGGASTDSFVFQTRYRADSMYARLPKFISLSDFGAVGDRQEITGASMASGSNLLGVGTNIFSASDVGKMIYVDNAGVSGANLLTTITAVNSPSQIALALQAGSNVSNARVIWGTDNVAAIDSAIAQNLRAYDQVNFFVPAKGYLTSRKISIPAITTAGAKSISFKGETFPSQWFGTVTEDPLNQSGSIIQCLSQVPGDAIFKFEPGTGAYFGVSLIHPVFEKLNLRTYDQPVIDGINAYAASHLIVDHVDITTGVFSVIAKEPSPMPYDANGLRTPKIDNGALTILRNVSVSGFFVGIEINEHTAGDYLNLTCNWYGLNFKYAGHASNFNRVNGQRNHRNINFAGQHYVTFDLLNIEHAATSQTTPANAWQLTDFDIQDPSNAGIGDIRYHVVEGGVGPVATFTKQGGANINSTRLGTVPTVSVPTALPNTVFGGATNLTSSQGIRLPGAAVVEVNSGQSSDGITNAAEINMFTYQTNATGLMGRLNVVNNAISASEQRIGTWEIITGSVPTTGKHIFNVMNSGVLSPILILDPRLVTVNGMLSTNAIAANIKTVTSAYTVLSDDYTVNCSGSFTVNLPDATSNSNRIIIVKNTGTGAVIIDPSGAQTIDGAATVTLLTQWSTLQLQSDGSNWLNLNP